MRCLVLLLAGCATLLGEEVKKIHVTSDPPGAQVSMDGLPVGRAPLELSIVEQEGHDFTYRWDDGAVASCSLTPSLRPLFLVVDVLGGVAGLATDAATGLWMRQDADACAVRR